MRMEITDLVKTYPLRLVVSNQTIGGGLMYDDTFDGAQLNVGNDKVQVQGAYGYMMEGAAEGNAKSG